MGVVLSASILISIFLGSLTTYSDSLSNEENLNDLDTQIELLHMLFNHNPSDLARNMTFGVYEEQRKIPNVVFIATLYSESGMFLIGIDSEVTPEAVDFILSFTGIPREKAVIDQFLGVALEISPEFDVDGLYYGFHPNFLNHHPEVLHYARNANSRMVSGGVVMMGQMINIPGVGAMTLGHPNNISGSRFFTAPHRILPNGTIVNQGSTRIGSVTRSFYGWFRDVAEVAVGNGVDQVSSRVPWANHNITNFRGNAIDGMLVRSIRGSTGVIGTRIEDANSAFITATGQTWFDMILTYPNVRSEEGDSGAALIHTSGTAETVLGTRKGRVDFSGRIFGMYTRVDSYN